MKIVVFVTLSLLVLASSQHEKRKPDQVIELFRHGARSPNTDFEIWPDLQKGQLTSEGMREHYQLGKTLSEKYAHLIETGYNPKDFYAVSNDVQRCIESALVHLTSLFRGKQSTLEGKNHPQESIQHRLIEQISNLIPKDDRNISPINVDTVDSNTKFIFRGNEPQNCPNLAVWSGANFYSPQAQAGWKTFSETINEVNAKLPNYQQIYDIGSLVNAYDAIIAAKFEKRVPAGGIEDEVLIKKLELVFAYFIYHLEQGQLIQRHLSSFNTLDVVLREMGNFRDGKDPKKMVFLSGHDKNIYSVLAAFNIVNNGCLLDNYDSFVKSQKLKYPQCYYPYYASNLIFEFYNDPTDPYVQFYYNDVLIPICNGQEKCSYKKFAQFVNDATGNNDKTEYDRKCSESAQKVVQELQQHSKPKQPKKDRDQDDKSKPKKGDDPKPERSNPKHNDNNDDGGRKPTTPPPVHQDLPKRNDDNTTRHDPQPQNKTSESSPHLVDNTSRTQSIKAVAENSNHHIVSIAIICLLAIILMIVFLRVLLNRRKYVQIKEDPDHASLEVS